MQKLSFKLQALLLLASMLLLSSCMVNHARIYEHAIEYEAVKVENPHTCYRHAGKLYLCGRQAKAHDTRNSGHMGFKEAIVGPSRWETTMVPGTESQPVFREVEIDGKEIVFKSGSTWQTGIIPRTSPRTVKYAPSRIRHFRELDYTRDYMLWHDNESRHMTWRGLYAVPASVAVFAIECPYNIISSVFYLFMGTFVGL
ncbi:MAG: hypothetical protein E7032_08385 [Akkermansiaceae bacterium]|nr:hypothetical protein [Akkermansiaceae bacterium]